MSKVTERIGKHVAIAREFRFTHLPPFARFIRKQHLATYVDVIVATSRAVDLPMLRHFSHFSEQQVRKMRMESHTTFLEAAEHNILGQKLVHDLGRWLSDKLELMGREDIAVEDITLGTYVRKKALTSLLPLYTSDVKLCLEIIDELDRYGVAVDTAAMNVYLNILSDTIAEQKKKDAVITARLQQSEQHLKKAQEISNVGHWTWDLVTGKIE